MSNPMHQRQFEIPFVNSWRDVAGFSHDENERLKVLFRWVRKVIKKRKLLFDGALSVNGPTIRISFAAEDKLFINRTLTQSIVEAIKHYEKFLKK